MSDERRAEYPFPLRPDFFARLILPPFLTKREVERLTTFLETLVCPPEDVEHDEREEGK